MPQWNPRPSATFVDIRPGGPGNSWKPLDRDASFDAPSGGGQSVESRFGRGADGNLEYRGGIVTGNPERWTANLMSRLKSETFLSEGIDLRCPFDVRVRQKCDNPYDLTNYSEFVEYRDNTVTSYGYSEGLSSATEDNEADVMNQYAVSAGVEVRVKKLRHDDISKTWSDFAINKVRAIGTANRISRCGTCSLGDQDFVAVTDQDSTPGYQSIPAPLFLWTTDGGNTWSSTYIDVLPNANALDVVRVGELVLVACPTIGVAYATLQDIKDGVPVPWTLATGFTAPNGPNALHVQSGVVYAAGDGGRIWRSTDGGLTFDSLDAGATTSANLNSIAGVSDNLIWIAGDSGVLLRYSGGVVSLVAVRDASATVLSDNINAVAVADTRGAEVYLGTSAGQVWVVPSGTDSKPVAVVRSFPQSGNGSIADLQFAGLWGDVLFVAQNNADGQSRILRDLSGGAMGAANTEVIGGFATPANNGINSIAPVDVNTAITAGEVETAYAFIGKVQGLAD